MIGHVCVLISLVLNIDLPKISPNVYAQTEVVVSIVPTPTPSPVVDTRRTLLERYLTEHNCPLAANTDDFINMADKYGIDYRLLPAISVKESGCGRKPHEFNPFGFGQHHFKNNRYGFNSFSESIEYVGSTIAGQNNNEKAFNKADKDAAKILMIYNGTVNPQYPLDVMAIMEDIDEQ